MARWRIEADTVWGYVRFFLARLLGLAVVLGFVVLLLLAGTGAFITYRIVTTRNETENVTPASYLLSSYLNLNFTDPAGGEHEGWLLLGLRGAPAIILCHGFNSNRSDLLPLATVLRENHFNVYVFNFHGPKAKRRYSDLGVRQASDVLAAIETVTKQRNINPHRVGLYGTTLGGYAALASAQQSPLVKALVVDTIYDHPDQFFQVQLERSLGGSSALFRFLAEKEFHLLHWGTVAPPIRQDLGKLENIPKLFVSGRDVPPLARITEDLYSLSPPPKQLLVFERSQASLASGAEKKEYENQILSFFLQNLPRRAD